MVYTVKMLYNILLKCTKYCQTNTKYCQNVFSNEYQILSNEYKILSKSNNKRRTNENNVIFCENKLCNTCYCDISNTCFLCFSMSVRVCGLSTIYSRDNCFVCVCVLTYQTPSPSEPQQFIGFFRLYY